MATLVAFHKSVDQAASALAPRYDRVFQITPGMSDAFMDDDKKARSLMMEPPIVAGVVLAEDYDAVFAAGKSGVRILRNSTHANMDVYVLMKSCAPVIKERTFLWGCVVGDDMASESTVEEACGCGHCSRNLS